MEARAKVTGAAEYIHNLHLPGMLWAKICRSTVPHGRIRHIDTSAATAMPGVERIVTAVDIRKVIAEPYYGPAFHDQPILAEEKVRHVGEPVAAVLAADRRIAEEAAQAIVIEYEPLPGKHVNGELTQGENIADIGGVKLAYAALQKALDKNPQAREQKIDGFTPEQRFFLSFAAIWRSKIRDEEQKLRLNTDPHSPAQYRVNGPLSDLPEFAKAFDVPDGSPMVRPADKRVNIW